jgi:hypothetical protein
LNHENLKGWTPHTHIIEYEADILSSLSRLESLGFVTQHIKINLSSIQSGAQESLGQIRPIRTFSQTPLGERFLAFIATGKLE